MQMMIDIDEDTYKYIISRFKYQNEGDYGLSEYEKAGIAIKNGKPLSKGHGRLIDADEFHHTLEDMPMRDTDKWFNWLQKVCNRLAEAPTIVEADTESEE